MIVCNIVPILCVSIAYMIIIFFCVVRVFAYIYKLLMYVYIYIVNKIQQSTNQCISRQCVSYYD